VLAVSQVRLPILHLKALHVLRVLSAVGHMPALHKATLILCAQRAIRCSSISVTAFAFTATATCRIPCLIDSNLQTLRDSMYREYMHA